LDGINGGRLVDVPGGILVAKHFFNVKHGLTICRGTKKKRNLCNQPDANNCNSVQLFVSIRLDRSERQQIVSLAITEQSCFRSRTMSTGNRAFIKYFFFLIFLSFRTKGYRGWEEDMLGKTGLWTLDRDEIDRFFTIPKGFSSMLQYLQIAHGCAVCGAHFAKRKFPPPNSFCECTFAKRFLYNDGNDQNAFETFSLPRLMSLEPLFQGPNAWYKMGNERCVSYSFVSDRLFDVHVVHCCIKTTAAFQPRVQIFFHFKCADPAGCTGGSRYLHRETVNNNALYVEKINAFRLLSTPTTLQHQMISRLLFDISLSSENIKYANHFELFKRTYNTNVLQEVSTLLKAIKRHKFLYNFFEQI
jgi:hypothetical protein